MADRSSPMLRLLDGPAPTLPALLDAVSERWWRARPRARSALVVAAVVVVLAAGAGHVASSPWGPPVTVLVAATDLEVGTELSDALVRRGSWPADLVPDDALPVDGSTATRLHPTGATVVAPVPAGTVVTARHLAQGGLAAVLPADHVAVPLPAGLVPDVPAGAHIDLVGPGADGRGTVLAGAALTLTSDGAYLWVAVRRDAAPDVAVAAAGGQLTAALLPSP